MKDSWISFEEKKPDDLEEIMVSCVKLKRQKWGPSFFLGTYARNEFVPYEEESEFYSGRFKPTHWLTIPNPPEYKSK